MGLSFFEGTPFLVVLKGHQKTTIIFGVQPHACVCSKKAQA